MKINIRVAVAGDADGLVMIKDQLPLTYSDGRVSTGGFY